MYSLTALVKHGCSTYMEFNIKIIGEELAAKLLVNGIFQYIGEKKHPGVVLSINNSLTFVEHCYSVTVLKHTHIQK